MWFFRVPLVSKVFPSIPLGFLGFRASMDLMVYKSFCVKQHIFQMFCDSKMQFKLLHVITGKPLTNAGSGLGETLKQGKICLMKRDSIFPCYKEIFSMRHAGY